MDPRQVTPYLIVALVVWSVYRRMRRSFGRQRVRDGFMWFRIALFTLAATFIAAQIARDDELLGILLASVAGGAVLGYVGLLHTKFEITPDGRFYTPHTYIGLAVTALFLGRMLYRFLGMYNGLAPAATQGQDLAAIYRHSPFTLVVIGAVVGYYVFYYAGVLLRTRAQAGRVTA
jgi:hypothetical protein